MCFVYSELFIMIEIIVNLYFMSATGIPSSVLFSTNFLFFSRKLIRSREGKRERVLPYIYIYLLYIKALIFNIIISNIFLSVYTNYNFYILCVSRRESRIKRSTKQPQMSTYFTRNPFSVYRDILSFRSLIHRH